MKKCDVIRYLNNYKDIKKQAKILDRKIRILQKEYHQLFSISRHLEYVNLIDDVPVYLFETFGGFNIVSPFEESTRSAFIETILNTRRYKIKLLKSENNHVIYDKTPTKMKSLSVAARWIDKGEIL